MVVCRRAVSAFLDRKLRNSDKAKRFSLSAVNKKLAKLDPQPKFVHDPYLHQKICFLLCLKYPGYGLLLDMGLGKTKLTLDLFNYQKKCGKAKRMLVLVPCTSNIEAWRDECSIHAPNLCVVGFDNLSKQDKLEALEEDYDIVIMTYAGWLRLVSELREKLVKKKKTSKLVIIEKLARKFEKLFDFGVFDESTFMGGQKSSFFKMCKRLAKTLSFHYVLTGTPFGKDPHLLWSQFFTIDFGDTLGGTIGMFRAAFFKEVRNYWSGFNDYVFDDSKIDEFYKVLKHSSIRYKDSECLDLPELVSVDVPVVFSKETWSYYDKLVEEMQEAKGNFKALDNAFVRMRQLASGYMTIKDPEDERHIIKFKDNPKLEILIDILSQVPEDKSVLIFHEYIETGKLIAEHLKKNKIKYLMLNSKVKNKQKVQKDFRAGKCKILIANQAAAFGLNLQIAKYGLFYEPIVDPIIYKQMVKRFHRGGQTEKTFAYHFYVKKSIEKKIIDSAKEGESFFNRMIEGKEII